LDISGKDLSDLYLFNIGKQGYFYYSYYSGRKGIKVVDSYASNVS
jgi:hypothetical protein